MLMIQSSKPRPSFHNFSVLCRLSAIALFVGAAAISVRAQEVGPQLVASVSTEKPLDLATVAGVSYSSSNSDVASPVDPAEAARLALSGAAMQPPPRRRYGRPRYNDNQHNPDGSAKYGFVLGAGFTAPVGNTFHYLNTTWAIQVGAGRNFSKKVGVMAQFDFDKFGFNGRTLFNEQSLYNYSCSAAQQSAGNCSPITNLDGNSHIWSFSLNPVYTFYDSTPLGAYVVGGVGFYHKVANFTLPQNVCADYYCYYTYTANQNVDHYTSNAPGFNGGFGITYKAGKFSSEHLFAEVRYVVILNSQRTGLTASNITTAAGQTYYKSGGTDYYPANSNRTTYTVYKAGIRF